MASSIYIGLILFTLVHLGVAYSIWGLKNQQEATLDATLDILKSVNKKHEASDVDEKSKLLADKLLTLLKQVHGMDTDMFDSINDNQKRYMSEAINIIVNLNDDAKLEEAEKNSHMIQNTYNADYLYFLEGQMSPDETKTFSHEVLNLDNEQSIEYTQVMTNFFKIFVTESQHKLINYREKFPSTAAFLNELNKYNQRNEWNLFMMLTTAYKLQSLQSNNNNYLKEFKRLRKQLLHKLAMHELKFDEALAIARAKEL